MHQPVPWEVLIYFQVYVFELSFNLEKTLEEEWQALNYDLELFQYAWLLLMHMVDFMSGIKGTITWLYYCTLKATFSLLTTSKYT